MSDHSLVQTPNPDRSCRYCFSIIPSAASVCSHCQRHQTRWKQNVHVVGQSATVLSAIVSIGILIATCFQLKQASATLQVAQSAENHSNQVAAQADKFREQMGRYGKVIDAETLSAQARAGDQAAFDKLLTLENSTLPEVSAVAHSTISYIVVEPNALDVGSFGGLSTQAPPNLASAADLDRFLGSKTNIYTSIRALRESSLASSDLLPALLAVMKTDNRIEIVKAAFGVFNKRTGQNFKYPDRTAVIDWWESHSLAYARQAKGPNSR